MANEISRTAPSRFGPHQDDLIRGVATITNQSGSGGESAELVAARTDNLRNYITDLIISNIDGPDLEVIVKDGSTEVMRIPAPQGAGAIIKLTSPLRGSEQTAWNVETDRDTAGESVRVSYSGYTA